ncbi:MAG TPA: DUF4136 domain-containing protein [Croceibacterium sp.]
MRNLLRPSAIAAAVLLAGCTSTYVSPVEVTRFTGTQPQLLGSGPITVQTGAGAPADSLELNVFRDAVARELQEQGYVIINGEAPQIAEVTIDLAVEQPGYRNSPVSVGGGVAGGSYGSSAGVGVGIDLTPRPSERLHRELRVMIKPAQGGTALWEGRARFTASTNSSFADTQAAATKLADALFGGFPGHSGETIEVE